MPAPRVHCVWLPELQTPLTQAMLTGANQVTRFKLRQRRGYVADGEIELPNVGLAFLDNNHHLALVDAPDGTLANARILCRARVSRIGKLKGAKATLSLTCAPASYKEDLRAAANALAAGAAIPPWTVKVIPTPDPGCVAVAFARSAAASWAIIKPTAIKVASLFQQDLVRTPYSKIGWKVLNLTNARVVLTIPAAAAPYAMARAGGYAHIGISADADPTHAGFFSVGRIMSVSAVPVQGTVDVELNMADTSFVTSTADPDRPVLPSDPTAAGSPHFDALYPGNSTDISTSVLEGRSETWHVDPTTHAITREDIVKGVRVVALGAGGDETSFDEDIGDSPVAHVKLRVVAEWEQRAVGSTDLSSIIALAAGGGAIQSVQENLKEPLGDPKVEFKNWAGWQRGKSNFTRWGSKSGSFSTNRTFNVTYRIDQKKASYTDENGTIHPPSIVQGEEFDISHSEFARLNIKNFRYSYFFALHDYSQQRREVADLVLDVGCRETGLGADTLDLGTITLRNLTTIEGVLPYQQGTIYNAGDRVLLSNGRVYECLADGTTVFWQINSFKTYTRGVQTTVTHPAWKDLGTQTPLVDWRSPTFFETDRGRQALDHAWLRMRAHGLRRLQMLTVQKTYPWDVARDVTLRDEVTMQIRDASGRRTVRGKVVDLEHVIDGAGVASVRVKSLIALGTGRNDVVAAKPKPYVGQGYVAGGYTPTTTNQYLAPTLNAGSTTGAVGSDLEYRLEWDDLALPVDAYRLQDPNYACMECFINNPAGLQMSEIISRCWIGRDPRGVTRDMPTSLEIAMRPLWTVPTIERFARGHGILTWSPDGFGAPA